MEVYLSALGTIDPFKRGNLHGQTPLTPVEVDLADFGLEGQGLAVDPQFLRSEEFESKSLMNLQSLLIAVAQKECLTPPLVEALQGQPGILFSGNGPVSLPDMTVRLIHKYLFDEEGSVDFNRLGAHKERMPPLDGIKILSTAQTHFVSRSLDLHAVGNPIGSGPTSSFNALVEACHAIHEERARYCLVVTAESPFFQNSLPYAYPEGTNGRMIGEAGAFFLLASKALAQEKRLPMGIRITAAASHLIPHEEKGWDEEGLLNHLAPLGEIAWVEAGIPEWMKKSPWKERLQEISLPLYLGACSGAALLCHALLAPEPPPSPLVLTNLGKGGHLSSLRIEQGDLI